MGTADASCSYTFTYDPNVSLTGDSDQNSASDWGSGRNFGLWALSDGDVFDAFTFDLTGYGYSLGDGILQAKLTFCFDTETLDTTGSPENGYSTYYKTGGILRTVAFTGDISGDQALAPTASDQPVLWYPSLSDSGMTETDSLSLEGLEATGLLQGAALADFGTFTFQTAELEIETADPMIMPVPLPGAVWLLCSGLAGLLISTRRSRR